MEVRSTLPCSSLTRKSTAFVSVFARLLLVIGIAAAIQVGVAEPEGLGGKIDLTRRVSGHLLAEHAGIILAAVMLRRLERALCEETIELVRASSQVLHRLLVAFAVAEGEADDRLFFRNDPFLRGLGGPGQGNARRHHIEPHLFRDVDDGEDGETVFHREHRSHGKDRFVVVGDLPVDIAMLLLEPFTDEPYVDAPHGAAGAGAHSGARHLPRTSPP